MGYMDKYTIRKLIFILILVLLVASPFIVVAYESATTTDPYILMARAIEDYEGGDVDVLNLHDHPNISNGISLIVYIEDFPNWSIRKDQENFKRHVLQIIHDYEFDAVVIILGWDYVPKTFRAQGAWVCLELRSSFCEWDYIPGVEVPQEFIKWPGIGKP
jgi:hypothetical protein